MATNLFSLVGSILIDNDKANESLAKTDQKAQGVGKSFLDAAGKAGKFAAGIATAAAGVTAALVGVAKGTADTADNIDKMSQRLGLSREGFQELDFVLSQSGVDINSFQTGVKSLVANMDKVTEGNKTAMENFNKLGLSVRDSSGHLKDEETMLFQTIQAFQRMDDSTEKSRLAMEMFGKQGQEILPLLNSEAGSFEELKQKAHDLGIVLGDDVIDNGVELTDTLDQLKRSFKSLVDNLGGSLVPILNQVSKFIIDAMPKIRELMDQITPVIEAMFDALLPQLTNLASSLLPAVMSILQTLTPVFTDICNTILPAFVELIDELLPPIMDLVNSLMPTIVSIIQSLLPLLQPLLALLRPILDLVLTLIKPLVDLINVILPPLVEYLSVTIETALNMLKPLLESLTYFLQGDFLMGFAKIGMAVGEWWEGLKKIFTTMVKTVKDLFIGMKDKVVNTFNELKNKLKAPINAILKFINKMMDGVTDGLNAVIRAMNGLKFKVPDWVPALGGKEFGFNLKELTAPQIPMLAEGAVIEPNKPFAAVLGDQKSGTNIEAPLSTIEDAVRNVISQMNININLQGELDDNNLFKRVRKEATIYNNMTGNPAFN